MKPGSTVEHRIELKIAAKPGTATEAPDTLELAPEPDSLFFSGNSGDSGEKAESS